MFGGRYCGGGSPAGLMYRCYVLLFLAEAGAGARRVHVRRRLRRALAAAHARARAPLAPHRRAVDAAAHPEGHGIGLAGVEAPPGAPPHAGEPDALRRRARHPVRVRRRRVRPLQPLAALGLSAAPDETVAVHITVGTEASRPTPASLRVVKQLRPAIVVCVDHGCDRADLPLLSHALNVLQSCAALVESLDTPGASLDVVAKVEQFILRSRAERLVTGGDKLPPWRSMFASIGFTPLPLSNAAEAQAECLLRRTANHGFHVEKH